MSAARWQHIWEQADEWGVVSPADLARLCASFVADERLTALVVMRRQIDFYGPMREYLDAAKTAIDDFDPDCRFMAALVLAELLAWYPETVWTIIRRHSESGDDVSRLLATNFLLNHLLRLHGPTYQPQIDAMTKTSATFARSYAMRLMSVAGGIHSA